MPPDVSGSALKATTTEELRLRNYRNQLEQKNELELRDMAARHDEELQRVMETQTAQLENLRNAYDVRISEEAEALEEKLHEVRITNQERVNQEKQSAEDELIKLKTAHDQRVEDYKRTSEAQIQALRKQLQTSAEVLHEQAKKTAKRDREAIEK